MSRIYEIIQKPVITEKGTLVSMDGNQVVLRVRPGATKAEIRQAVEVLFSVRVVSVRTLNYLGKIRRVGRSSGRKPAWKKAYVKLAEDSRIDFFEQV